MAGAAVSGPQARGATRPCATQELSSGSAVSTNRENSEGPLNLPPLIPREILFGNPTRANPQVSREGHHLAYLAPDQNDVLQVWLGTTGREGDRKLTADKKRGIRSYFWTYDGDHLVYLQDSDGDENWHLYAVNITSNVVRDLTPHRGIQAGLIERSPDVPHELLIAMNIKDPRRHDVYRVDLKGGTVSLAEENPGNIVHWVADRELRVRAATATTPDGGMDLLTRETSPSAWKTIRHWGPEEQGYPVAFSANGERLYVIANHDANAMRLLEVNPNTGQERLIAEDAQYDVSGLLIHPTTRIIQAVSFYRDKLEWQVLDESIKPDFAKLQQVHQGEIRILGRDLADTTWIVAYETDDGPIYYYRYDRTSKGAVLLFSNRPQLEGLALAAMKPISFSARDGLILHGYLTTPPGVTTMDLPTVLLVHGGPWVRDTWGFDPMVQWLANRGYAVLQVNYRGSAGYGRKFLVAGFHEWAGKMHDDLIDAVHWVVREGVADPERIAIMGGSYGGYATLVGLTFTPNVFAAGVDIVGPSNLITFISTIPPYWEPLKALLARRVGNLETETEFLKSRSPLFYVDRIKAPLLIGQGANDPRVKQAESEQIVQAMRNAHRPVEYVVYSDEGHGFARPENRLHFYAQAEAFLAKYLGGRCEGLVEIKGHCGTIK